LNVIARCVLFAFATTALIWFAAPSAGATVAVREASIAEGETFEFSPFAFEVRFSESVQLVNARLIDQEGRDAPLDLSFYRQRAQSFVIELPVLLPHGYRLSWSVRGASGPDQQGSVGFVVKGCVDPRVVADRAASASPAIASQRTTQKR
jgi:methionine-rich copper-binding protein CopC